MTIAFDVITLALAGIMVGNEVAVACFIHPVLWRMEARTHAQTAAALATAMGVIMPAWYGLTLLLTLASIWEHHKDVFTRGPGPFLAAAACGWSACILFTVLRLSPLSDRLGRMDPDMPYAEWLADRSTWDGLQRWRVALLLCSLSFLSLGVLGIWRDYIPGSHPSGAVQNARVVAAP